MTWLSHPATLPMVVTLAATTELRAIPSSQDRRGARANDDVAELLDGVSTVQQIGVPGSLSVYGEDAFAVLTGGQPPTAIVGAARFGQGRVVAIAHEVYLQREALGEPDSGSARLVRNAIAWCAGGEGPQRIGVIGHVPAVADALDSLGHEVLRNVPVRLDAEFDLLVWPLTEVGVVDPAEVQSYVRAGGGLLAALCPWGWQQIFEDRGWTLRETLPHNRALAPMGLVFGSRGIDASDPRGYVVDLAAADSVHAGRAVEGILRGREGSVHPVAEAIRALPPDETEFRARLSETLGGFRSRWAPRSDKPLREGDKKARLQATWACLQWRSLAAADVETLPGVDEFPGEVPRRAKRIDRSLSFDPAVPGWQGTGLYVPPGEVVEVEVGDDPTGWRVRVGCHTDTLWHLEEWKRWPEIILAVPLLEPMTAVATPFGGLLYFERTGENQARLEVVVRGAVAAPRFVLGDAESEAAWKDSRRAPGPWAELEGRRIVLSLPSEVIRKLRDPAPVLRWWDSIVEHQCELAAVEPPARRERFVPDVQISVGYMHSGYPIMMHLDMAEPVRKGLPPLLDLQTLSREGRWGPFHELGHNRQRAAWTFDGTVEVTCNLFTLYSLNHVVGIDPWDHESVRKNRTKARRHLEAGAPFETWKKDAGLALFSYVQVQHAFGWEPFRAVFAEYERLDPSEHPRDDLDKVHQWIVRLSIAAGHDLRPFYRSWGFPVAGTPEPRLDALPVWVGPLDD